MVEHLLFASNDEYCAQEYSMNIKAHQTNPYGSFSNVFWSCIILFGLVATWITVSIGIHYLAGDIPGAEGLNPIHFLWPGYIIIAYHIAVTRASCHINHNPHDRLKYHYLCAYLCWCALPIILNGLSYMLHSMHFERAATIAYNIRWQSQWCLAALYYVFVYTLEPPRKVRGIGLA